MSSKFIKCKMIQISNYNRDKLISNSTDIVQKQIINNSITIARNNELIHFYTYNYEFSIPIMTKTHDFNYDTYNILNKHGHEISNETNLLKILFSINNDEFKILMKDFYNNTVNIKRSIYPLDISNDAHFEKVIETVFANINNSIIVQYLNNAHYATKNATRNVKTVLTPVPSLNLQMHQQITKRKAENYLDDTENNNSHINKK